MSHLRGKPTTLVFIDDIKPGNNSYKLKVCVMKLWKLWRSKKVVSIEMVLEDAIYRTNPFYQMTSITSCNDFPSYLPNKFLKKFLEIHSGIFKNDILIG
ncbi:hypothetical protein YC2023_040701 [Brassica napus]